MIGWLRSLFDKGHREERKAVRVKVNHALGSARDEKEASRRARLQLELELKKRVPR